MHNDIPRIVVAGAASSVGKTTVTAGLIAAFRKRGLTVQPFKCGPDYIDPSYHEKASGRPCRNLDTWMLDDDRLLEGFARAARDADIAVVEGVMGLFDGSDWHHERGSTAQIAKLLDAPVLLVVDISGAARSAAIPVLGCQQFDKEVALRAVALNFAGSEGHAKGCAGAIERSSGLPVVGWLPRESRLRIPERHLGLTPGGERGDADTLIDAIAVEVERRFDVAAVLHIARAARAVPTALTAPVGRSVPTAQPAPAPPEPPREPPPERPQSPRYRRRPKPVLAVARDAAFCFYYPENLELLSDAGAEIQFFSPLRGECPGAGASGVYLGGGYPELHGRTLAENTALWRLLQDLEARGSPIYAECGGFMVLTQALIDLDGHEWPMAGVIPGVVRMGDKLAALGYRSATAIRSNLIADAGETLRGHEFRYSSWIVDDAVAGMSAAWRVQGTRSQIEDAVGYVAGNALGSYVHLHFGQRIGIAARFVEKLRESER
jgi:cobyrinic acid a,c-diamide synthase